MCHKKMPGRATEAKKIRFIQSGRLRTVAMPGDTVVIGGGTYREWVNPKNGGLRQ